MPTLVVRVAQMAAARLGVEEYTSAVDSPPLLDRGTAESFISVDAARKSACDRLRSASCCAVTSEGKTAQECQGAIQEHVAGLRSRWQRLRNFPGEHCGGLHRDPTRPRLEG